MRRVSWFRIARRSILLPFGAIWLAAGSTVLLASAGELREERRYREAARTGEGVVLDKSFVPASREGNPRTDYRVRYRFTTAAGETVEGAGPVDVDEWERLEAGSPLRVTYLPGEPATHRLAGEGGGEGALVGVVMGGVFALVGGAVAGRALRRTLREYHLLREGTVAPATVLAIVPSGTRVNRVPWWEIRYRYRDARGDFHEGCSTPLPPAEAHAVPVGGTGAACYDPRSPERSVWAGPDAPEEAS